MFDTLVMKYFNLPILISSMILVPSSTMGEFLAFLAEVRNINHYVINFEYAAY